MKALDRETATLLRALMRPAGAWSAAVTELTSSRYRWEDVIEAAREHGLLQILYLRLAALESVPRNALELARRGYERNAFHCISNAVELIEVLTAFETAGIRAMPFKGVVLGASVYGEITARAAGDLDLLIDHDDLPRATALLEARDYQLTSQVREDGSPAVEDYFEFHFERPSDGMVLELRWRLELTQPRYRHDLGINWVWPRRRAVRIAGAEVPDLDPVSSLLVLCMHGTKHVWSRLLWICDVAKSLQSERGLDWDLVQLEARRVGLWRCVALGVLLARRFTGCEVPPDVLRRFESNKTVRDLARFLHQNLLEHPGKLPPGWIPYNIKILGMGDRLSAVLSPAFFRPNARDRAVVKLPRPLQPLYYLIRPVRVLLDRRGR